MASVLVTGVAGFVGTHLSDHLTAQGHTVHGVDTVPQFQWENVNYSQVDICNYDTVVCALERAQPDQVYHLAGVSFPPDAEGSPRQSLQINVMGSVALLDAIRTVCPRAVTLLVGTSKVYEAGGSGGCFSEDSAVAPESFYAISKYASELIGAQFGRQMNLDVRFTRSFNHTGPGQSPRFVCSDWARQIARISAGRQAPRLVAGELSAEIDFSDVRDVVRAYHSIVTTGQRGAVYNVCSGRTVPLQYVLDYLVKKAGVPVEIVTDESKKKGHGPSRRLAGDNQRILSQTAWRPQYSLERTLDDLFAYWRVREA